MKTINETFTDEEHKQMKKLKGNLAWRDFIMLMVVHCEEAVKRGDLEIFKQKKEKKK